MLAVQCLCPKLIDSQVRERLMRLQLSLNFGTIINSGFVFFVCNRGAAILRLDEPQMGVQLVM